MLPFGLTLQMRRDSWKCVRTSEVQTFCPWHRRGYLQQRMSNRLLDIFHTESQKVGSETHDPALAKRPSKAPRHISRLAKKGDSSVNTRFKGVETRLERENRRLREQLKFQSAVLDRLAGDVHILEYNAASANKSERPSSRERDGRGECKPLDSGKSSASVATEDCNPCPNEPALTRQPLGLISQNSFSRDDGARLRSELKKARDDAARLRKELALAHREAEESKDTHIDLLSRERKFRAAVEAGLREKVQNIRHRARDREERLSTALSSVKAQLKEAVDLLASKEEEAGLARNHMAELEERAAVAMARLIERDRQARWFERRLAEVSSSEAEAMGLRLEEMATSLVNQQKELERLRALTKECDSNASSPRQACCEDRGTQTESERAMSGSGDDRTPFAERTAKSIFNGKLGVWRQQCSGPDARDSGVPPNNHLNVAGTSDVDTQEFGSMAVEAVFPEKSLHDVDKLVEWLISPADQASTIPGLASGFESVCICSEDSLKLLRSKISGAIAARASTRVRGDSVAREEVESMGRNDAVRIHGWRSQESRDSGARVPVLVEELRGINGGMQDKRTEAAPSKLQTVNEDAEKQSGAMSALKPESRKILEEELELSQERTAQGELEKGAESAGASLAEATTAELLDVTPRACVTPSKDKEGSPRTCYRLRERYGIDFEQESGKRWGEGAIRARMGERGAERDAELYALNVSLAQSLEHAAKLKNQLYAAQAKNKRTQEESRQTVQRSESRVLELERAWEALAAKVMSLANRNADLEWAILALRRDGHAMIPSCTCEPVTAAASVSPTLEAANDGHGEVMDGRRACVPRATLDLDSLIVDNVNDEGDETMTRVQEMSDEDSNSEKRG